MAWLHEGEGRPLASPHRACFVRFLCWNLENGCYREALWMMEAHQLLQDSRFKIIYLYACIALKPSQGQRSESQYLKIVGSFRCLRSVRMFHSMFRIMRFSHQDVITHVCYTQLQCGGSWFENNRQIDFYFAVYCGGF